MTRQAWEPRTGHVMIVEGQRKPPWTSTADKIATAEARLRDVRRAARRADDARAASQRPEPEPEPEPPSLVQANDPRHIDTTTAEWIVNGWRERGWQ
ncbi:hypothetical protein AAII07_28810 [Microvirga sp. 0TCS3.31]